MSKFLNENTISDISAKTLISANAYTDSKVAGLSVDVIKSELCSYARETSAASFEASKTYTNEVSANLSTALQTAINNKVTVDGKQADLSVVHLTQDEYHARVVAGTLISNEVYVVSSDNLNMYGEKIVNLGEPTLSSDAVTKNYVDTNICAKVSNIYKAMGSVSSYAELLSLSCKWDINTSLEISSKQLSSHIGEVWNVISDEQFSISGSNYVFVNQVFISDESPKFGWDILAGFSDFSKYATNDRLCCISTDLNKKDNYLSNSISSKIFIQNDISGNLCASYSTLSVLKLSRENWETSVLLCSDAELSNILFDISSDYIDAYNQPILNIGFPTNEDDKISAAVPYYIISADNYKLSSKIESIKNTIMDIYSPISATDISNVFSNMLEFKKSYVNLLSSLYKELSDF